MISFDSYAIYDLASLSTLPNLGSLTLSHCYLDGPSALKLSNLTGLKRLNITDTHISDYSQLSLPAGLEALCLQNNGISDFPQLSNVAQGFNLEN